MGSEVRAKWDASGQPVNVEAAIADALEWLDLLMAQPIVRRSIDATADLTACVLCLAAYGDAETREKYAADAPDPPPASPRTASVPPETP